MSSSIMAEQVHLVGPTNGDVTEESWCALIWQDPTRLFLMGQNAQG